jgi:hypothetical protein
MEHGVPIPTDASKNMLLGYHYALRQQSKQLAKEKIEIQKKKRFSHCSKRSLSQSMQRRIIHKQQKTSSIWIKVLKP